VGAVTSTVGGVGPAADDLGQTEIEDFDPATPGNKNIRRFDVAVNDPSGMGGIQGVRDLDAQRQEGIQIQRPAGNAMLERVAVEELHDDEGLGLRISDLVNGADVRMFQGGCGTGFAAKAFQGVLVFGNIGGQELDRDEAAEFRIFGLVDYAHSTAA
jgi:hypothetical protein